MGDRCEDVEEAGSAAQELEPAKLREKLLERINGKKAELQKRKTESLQSMEKQLQRILRANPTFRSKEYSDTVEELRQQLNK